MVCNVISCYKLDDILTLKLNLDNQIFLNVFFPVSILTIKVSSDLLFFIDLHILLENQSYHSNADYHNSVFLSYCPVLFVKLVFVRISLSGLFVTKLVYSAL